MGQKLLIRYFGALKGLYKNGQIFLVSALGQQATLSMIHTQAAQKGFIILKKAAAAARKFL